MRVAATDDGMIEGLRRDRPAFLASVTNAAEAEMAFHGGANIIDCKNPASGALGALDTEAVRDIVQVIAGRVPVSATIGDLPADAGAMLPAAAAMAATSVDIVKIGFFGDRDPRPAIVALGREKRPPTQLVAVLMADCSPDISLLPVLAAHGFAGAMLDTADKSAGRLTTVLSKDRLSEFVRAAAANGLSSGLAGSLQGDDIAGLARLNPDVLGFRGALCTSGRVSGLDPKNLTAVRHEFERARSASAAREKSVA
jgi:(5-formylfuran-3-yl)methyl phosphate synthase